MGKTFTFELTQVVKISESGETGTIVGRAEYATAENSYLMRYKAADGCAVESWWSERALEQVGPKANNDFVVVSDHGTAEEPNATSAAVIRLLNHIEDVVDADSWGRIDPKLWNAVTMRSNASHEGPDESGGTPL